jgi:TPR repeat protein
LPVTITPSPEITLSVPKDTVPVDTKRKDIVQEIPKNPIAIGDSLFKEKKYDKALIWYTQSAEQGNAEGQSRLGRMYAEGLGISKNTAKAMEWFKKSATQGNASGENGLAYIYQIQENDEEALKWYRKSAQRGLDIAQYNLGVMYEYGCGVKKNDKEAREWYKKSAAQGCPQAIEKLKNKTNK